MPRKMRSPRSRSPYFKNRNERQWRYRSLVLEALEDRATPAGLVAAYSFDATSGTTLTDVTGAGHTGTITGATWTTGKYGNALAFNGSNQLVTVADANDLDLTTAMTLEAWVYPTAVDGWETAVFKGRSGGLAYSLYSGGPNNGPPAGYITRTGTSNDIGADGVSALPLNAWSHIASTYDGSSIRLYVNGSLVRTTAAAGSIITTTNALTIGGNTVWPEWFAGRIDDVRIYDRVLSAQEIATDMVTPVGSTSSDITPPTVVAITPAMNTRNFAVGANMTVQFSEAMNAATINSSTIQLRDAAGNLIPAAVTYNSATFTATIDPTNALPVSATYLTARVLSGASGAKDAAGNPLAADFTWSLSTGTPQFQETTAFSGLVNPTVIKFAPDGRIFVAEKSGLIKVFDNLQDTTPTIFADLRTNVYNNWDRGLLGMTLSPNFATNPYVYVLYSLDAHTNRTAPVWGTPGVDLDPLPSPPGATENGVVIDGRISRIPVLANGTAGAEQVLLEKQWLQQFPSHSIGTLAFGPDGMLYASAGDGASFIYVDYGQTPTNVDPRNPASMGDPVNEGGALRTQDLLSPNDPTSLDGTIIRIDPNTAAAVPSNPLYATGFDENARRIIAFGLRNPFRFTFRPGTNEIWVGDVGWNTWEEINRIVAPTDALVENFGWPAYEGMGRMDAYDNANLPLLEGLYAQEASNPNAVIEPYYTYNHSEQVVPGSGEPTGSSAIAGIAFGQGGNLAGGYDGALFFTDYNRDTIWVMYRGVNGLPDPATRQVFYQSATNPLDAVNLEIGPDGSLFFPDLDSGLIRQIRMVGANQPPHAAISASATSGTAPLIVSFSAAGSSDPDQNPLTYSWDLNGDGVFGDSTAATPAFTYAASGTYNVQLRVTDTGGLSDVASVAILVGNAPTPFIDTPLPGTRAAANSNLTFSGHATDLEQGTLGASALTWTFSFYQAAEEDPTNINLRNRQTFAGVASGTYVMPDWEYPVFLVIDLTATDATGLQTTTSLRVDPQTVDLAFNSVPPGLELTINGRTKITPFTRTTVVGSSNTIGAASPQVLGTSRYTFTSWSDGGAISHLFTAPATAQTYTATLTLSPTPLGLVAAYSFDASSGTTLTDTSGNAHNGTITGATWTTGKYGNSLSFNGSNQMVTVADANDLDFSSGMTLEAYVYPAAINNWATAIMKERAGGLAYALYAGAPGSGPPGGYLTRTGTSNDIGANGLTRLPLNTWSHIAATYDGSNIRMYVNGVLVGTQAAAGTIVGSTNALRMGGNSIWGEWFNGRIDEVRLYNRALTVAEIAIDLATPVASLPVAPAAAMSGLAEQSLNATSEAALLAPALLPSNHTRRALDVSGDWAVTPLDALLIINRLNSGGGTLLRPLNELEIDAGFDASGDGFLSPLDALLVINYLNASFAPAQVDQALADDSWQAPDARTLSDEELFVLWDSGQKK
jgi:glucose/arabinose dehydrogenase/PKD repeat protein